jgi:hypothetical protein
MAMLAVSPGNHFSFFTRSFHALSGGADLIADDLLGGELEIDVEGADEIFSLHGEAAVERRVNFVAEGIDAVDGAAGFALEVVVEGFFETIFADGALHLKCREVFAGEVFGGDIIVDADVAEGVGGGGAKRVVARAGGVDLDGRADGETFDEARVFALGEIVQQRVRKEQLVAEVTSERGGIHFFGALEDLVNVVEIALHNADAGHAGERHVAHGGLGHAGFAVVAADDFRLLEKVGFELVEVDHDGEAGAIADEDGDAVARVDVAARAGNEDAALALDAFALVVSFGLEELLVGEAADERQEQRGHDEIEKDDAGIVAFVGLKQVARALGEM